MADPTDPWGRGERALEAYYYSFDPTGVREVDGILAAVALAGKSYHHTQDWNEADGDEESLADCIQRHAGIAAERFRALEREPTPADIAAWLQRNPDQVAEVLAALKVAGPWAQDSYGNWERRDAAARAPTRRARVWGCVWDEPRREAWYVDHGSAALLAYATAAEAMAAADAALAADGYALVGGVPQ